MDEYLNQSLLEQWETEDLWLYRQSLAREMAKMAIFISQADAVLEQRGER